MRTVAVMAATLPTAVGRRPARANPGARSARLRRRARTALPRLVGALSAALVAVVGVLPPPASAAAAANSAATAIPPLTFLHVVTPTSGPDLTPYLADAAGREVLLRGAAAVGMEDVAYPERERWAGPLPGGAVGLRRALSHALGADPATASLRGAGLASRLLPVHGSGERRRLRADARPRLQRGPPGPQLEPARAHGRHLLGDVSQPGGPGGGVGAPAGHLRDPRHAPGPVLPLHRARQARDGSLGLHPVGGRGRCAGVGRAGRRQTGVRAVRHRRAEPGRIGVLLQLLAQLDRRRPPGAGTRDRPAGPLHRRARRAGAAVRRHRDRPRLRVDERAAAGVHRFDAGRERVPGQQPGALPVLHAGHRGDHRSARRPAQLSRPPRRRR